MRKEYKKNNKQKKDVSFLMDILPNILFLFAVVTITKWVEKTCLNTLLPICIPWMYFQFLLIIIYVVYELISERNRSFTDKVHKREFKSFRFLYKSIWLLIIVPALILLPNRYICIGSEIKYEGIVVDKTTWAMTRTASWNNYVKIRLENLNTSFWCNQKKALQPNGSKCIVTVRRGVFGMRYVEDVSFLIE